MSNKSDKNKKQEQKVAEELLNTLNAGDIRSFRGNPLLKRAGELVELTSKHIKEYKRCMKDPVYFVEHYIKIVHVDKGLIPIKLYDYQKRILNEMKENRFNIVLSCRQSGKCVSINTNITLKHPKYNNGLPFSITIGDFYSWQYFKRLCKEVGISDS